MTNHVVPYENDPSELDYYNNGVFIICGTNSIRLVDAETSDLTESNFIF